jgi:hypothetical protein
MVLALRRIRVATVGVAIADAAIGAVNEEFGTLMAGDRASLVDGGRLGVVNRRGALSTGAADSPAAFMRYNVLISLRHFGFSRTQ